MMLYKVSSMIHGVATWIGGDTHLYTDHIPMAKEQLQRKPNGLPYLTIKKDLESLEDILCLSITYFELSDYNSYEPIKAELFIGLKK